MHGCVTQPQDIVLTRSDFIRYDERRAALRGIVQALLITKHMLFVGFSLRDDNFHRVIEDVRKAVRGNDKSQVATFGSALALRDIPWFRELWQDDLDLVVFSTQSGFDPFAARQQEIFLDYWASLAASSTRHLLEDRFDALLTDSERTIRDAVRELVLQIPVDARRSAAWQEIQILLERLGWNGSG